jgi:hypothetical protein
VKASVIAGIQELPRTSHEVQLCRNQKFFAARLLAKLARQPKPGRPKNRSRGGAQSHDDTRREILINEVLKSFPLWI